MAVNSGNLKTPQEKVGPLTGFLLILKLVAVGLLLPLAVPAIGWMVQASAWTFVLSRVQGIGFAGNFGEALALSAALCTFATALNLSILSLQDIPAVKKYFPKKAAKAARNDLKTWQDFGRTLPSGLQFLRQCAINSCALLAFSHLQPIALHFDNFYALVFCSAVLSAFWTLTMTVLSTTMFALVLRPQAKTNQ